MKEFKQWHEEDNVTFHFQMPVTFSDCRINNTIGLEKVLRYTSETAGTDFSERGMTTKFLLEKGFAILVSRVAYRFHKLPKDQQNIMVTTWEEKDLPLQFQRQYEITDMDTNEKLITGYSSWLLVDPVARRIIPTKKFDLRTPLNYDKGHDCMDPGKIPLPENMQLIDERKIRYSDIDANGHTNNARYGAFIEDALPEEYRTKDFSDFRINFTKEALLGETLQIFAGFDDEAKKITIAGKKENGETSFESELYWK